MAAETTQPPRRAAAYAVALWLLLALFGARVAGQAIQQWAPQSFLPPAGDFQGSGLPYWALLSFQVLIASAMARNAWRAAQGTLRTTAALRRGLGWFGGLYFGGSLVRVLVGLTVADAPRWFHTWIPAFFHLVLASWVLVLAALHRSLAKEPGHA